MIYNVVLVSGIQQSDLVIHTNISNLFQVLFPFRSLKNTIGHCWLFKYSSMYMSTPNSQFFIFLFIFNYSFTITSKRIKYLGINPPKEAKYLYCENYNMVMKEIEEDTNRKIDHILGFKSQSCQNDYTTPDNLQI